MQYRSNLPRPFNKGKKLGNRKIISTTSVNGKTVHQQVVYQIDGQSLTRHEKVQVFYIFPTQHCQDQFLPNTTLVLALIYFYKFYLSVPCVPCSYKLNLGDARAKASLCQLHRLDAFGRLWAPHFVRADGTPTAVCTFARVIPKKVCLIAYARTPW